MIKKTLTFFSILLLMHIAHIFEEIIGKAYFIETIYGGLANFVAIMLLLFALPLILFYCVAKNKRLAYQLSFIYTGIMIIDGLGHIAEFVLYRKYFYGSAGLFTGIGLIIIGIPLIYYIKKEMPNRLIHRKKQKYAIVGTKIILMILMLFLLFETIVHWFGLPILGHEHLYDGNYTLAIGRGVGLFTLVWAMYIYIAIQNLEKYKSYIWISIIGLLLLPLVETWINFSVDLSNVSASGPYGMNISLRSALWRESIVSLAFAALLLYFMLTSPELRAGKKAKIPTKGYLGVKIPLAIITFYLLFETILHSFGTSLLAHEHIFDNSYTVYLARLTGLLMFVWALFILLIINNPKENKEGLLITILGLFLFLPMVVSININADLSDMRITGFLLEGFSEKTLEFIESGGALLAGIVLLYFYRRYFSAKHLITNK